MPRDRGRSRLLVLAASLTAAALAVAGCGGGSNGSKGGPERQPRGSSVGDGLDGTPPIAQAVVDAAEAAGCSVRGFPSEGRTHVAGEPQYLQSDPPTSGPHFPVWADYGFYTEAVPYRFLVHNLEHGGIVLYAGNSLDAASKDAIKAFWRESPAYMVVVPGQGAGFPPKGVVVTSWQRWLVCKPYTANSLAAIAAFRDAYRGRGPEPVAGLDTGQSPAGLPKPADPDPGAKG